MSFKPDPRCLMSVIWHCRAFLKRPPTVFLCTRASASAALTPVLRRVSHAWDLAGDSDPAAAVALSLAVDDVAMLADSSVDLIDRANSTGVSIEDRWNLLFALVCFGSLSVLLYVSQVVSELQYGAALYGNSPCSYCVAHVTDCLLVAKAINKCDWADKFYICMRTCVRAHDAGIRAHVMNLTWAERTHVAVISKEVEACDPCRIDSVMIKFPS